VHRLPEVSSTSIGDVVQGFVPARRFARVTFDSYAPDPRYPSQQAARDRLRLFAAGVGQSNRAHLLGRLIRKPHEAAKAIYLDGGYGVGKTLIADG
jgi:cell division protein ZapE